MKSYIDLAILIPTFKRQDLLTQCLFSISKQEVIPKEIWIGNDDSTNYLNEDKLNESFSLPIKVINRPIGLGQTKNVNDLIEKCTTSWLMLLHDDDLLIENSLKNFFECVDVDKKNCVYFGMQKLLTKNKLQNTNEAIQFNNRFSRNRSLNVLSNFDIVLKHSIPSNGFIINSSKAKEINYLYSISFNNYGIIKDACDYAFTWKCFKDNLDFIFIPLFTSVYRITEGSVSNSKNVTILESFLIELDVYTNYKLTLEQKSSLKTRLRRRFRKSLKTCFKYKYWPLLYKILLSKFTYSY